MGADVRGEACGRPDRHRRLAAVAAVVATLAGCGTHDAARRPSVLLVVLDTTRTDAVSAYGAVAGTTPTVDGLAAAGVRYTHAYTQAPWTLPAHATLFTGLLPSKHGVDWRNLVASNGLLMLAERLRRAGYETAGVSENGWVSPTFNMTQGFERFKTAALARRKIPDVVRWATRWIGDRRTGRPFFLFVNVVDAHAPYAVRAANPYLPPGVTIEQAKAMSQEPADYFCAHAPQTRDLALLRGLYLGEVHAADAKLGKILEALRAAGLTDGLLTIVTSDHGEHLGEHGLSSHQFSVHEELLHVPLVLHATGMAPAVVDTPVPLASVVPTVLRWTGLATDTDRLPSRPLPMRPTDPAPAASIAAEFADVPEASKDGGITRMLRSATDRLRRHCTPEDRVFGDMRALVRYPFKLGWSERYPATLFDLRADPGETHDLAAARPDLVAELRAELGRLVATGPLPRSPETEAASPERMSPQVLDQLRALGYVGDGEEPRR